MHVYRELLLSVGGSEKGLFGNSQWVTKAGAQANLTWGSTFQY